jgi:hypothetical protein
VEKSVIWSRHTHKGLRLASTNRASFLAPMESHKNGNFHGEICI